MKVTVCFDSVRVVVPCGDGSLLVKDLMREAIIRYRKATGKLPTGGGDTGPVITSLSSLTGGGLLDPDDRLCDVADDREQIIAHLATGDNHGDGASSVGTNSPDFFGDKEVRYRDHRTLGNIKRESVKRLSMHALSTREHMATYNALSLPRESKRREPLGQDAAAFERPERTEVQEIVIKNEPGVLGVDMMPCYDLQGNDQGLRVEKIYPNGRIAKDGRIELHDKIIRINGHNLLRVHFQEVQKILRSCTNDPCLKISVVKAKKLESEKKISSYNVLQSANTRKIGRMIEIELTKGSDGLGFSVTTRDNPAGGHMPIYIKNILTKGAAVTDGQLKSGDRLLKVNDIEMTGKSQEEVVNFLRNIPPGGKVRMVVSRQEEANLHDYGNSSSGPREQAIQPVQENRWNTPTSSPTKEREEKPYSPRKKVKHINLDIPVFDSEKAGLGVSVKGKTSNDQNSNPDLGIFIKSVLHGGAASRDGRLMTNDQLLEINGESLLGLSNSVAMDTLRRAMVNSKSATTGIISLKVARQVSPNVDGEKSYQEELISGMGNCKVETANSIYIDDKEVNGLDNGNLSPVSWNPVIDRLTEQYNKNRNESYCLATNKTWRESMSHKLFSRAENILLEDSQDKRASDKDSQYTDDPTYDSQLSLEEFSGKFARDAVGRQSMSEKGHATLDAKNTDTYKRNKKLKETKDDLDDKPPSAEIAAAAVSREINLQGNGSGSGVVTESASFEATRRRFEKKSTETEYYQVPKARKHWLVDDERQYYPPAPREEGGFDNSRGDVKQASLNALDKRTKKKGKVSAILRLVKNRKSLNLGDNIDSRDNNNYMSGTINYIQ